MHKLLPVIFQQVPAFFSSCPKTGFSAVVRKRGRLTGTSCWLRLRSSWWRWSAPSPQGALRSQRVDGWMEGWDEDDDDDDDEEEEEDDDDDDDSYNYQQLQQVS